MQPGPWAPYGWGVRLKALREARGWSQAELAALAGVSQQSESDHERGRAEPDLGTLIAYARALECSVDELLAVDSPPVSGAASAPALPYGGAADPRPSSGGGGTAGLSGRVRRLEGEVAELRERLAVLEVLVAGKRRPLGAHGRPGDGEP